jgi:ribosomal protein S18 acetylase RimI-like enzyme
MHEKEFTAEGWKEFFEVLENEKRSRELFDKSFVFICRNDADIIGAAYFIPHGNPEGFFKKEWAYIRRVSVDPAFHGRGIAKELTKLCIEKARELGEKTIVLHTAEFMKPAIHIYESFGFKILKEVEPICGKRYWLYKLDL